MTDLMVTGLRVGPEQFMRGQDHAGRAIAALEAVLVPKRLLQWMQLTVAGQAFDRGNRRSIRLHGQSRTRFDCNAIKQHRTGATLARVARSEEHTSELQSRSDLVCRLLLE